MAFGMKSLLPFQWHSASVYLCTFDLLELRPRKRDAERELDVFLLEDPTQGHMSVPRTFVVDQVLDRLIRQAKLAKSFVVGYPDTIRDELDQ